MNRKLTLLFTVSSVLFLMHQYVQKIAKVSLPMIDSYLDPTLFMPIVLPLIGWERQLIYKNPGYTIPSSHVFGCFLLVSVLFEIVLPLWNERMTADVWDVPFYALGALIYTITANDCCRSLSTDVSSTS
ncbi:hypothetical protein [Sphingobacterium gobiense]|uniref:hypothetical protein n=1 Tax=Sphingobacterium gobiense TaxID=1382456 RepID=UPI0015E2EE13|nr:hypothetical protein [Sphingobacterium gobiense]